MVDPTDVTKFDRNDHDLQEFWLFCLSVAGKSAATQVRNLDAFLRAAPGTTPFDKISRLIAAGRLREALVDARMGQYRRLVRSLTESLSLDLRTCTVADLEAIHGVGPKTARMLVMHSRPGQRVAALDTHLLKFLRANGHPDAPKGTPASPKVYRRYEEAFLALADASGMGIAEFDLEIWRSLARLPAEPAWALAA